MLILLEKCIRLLENGYLLDTTKLPSWFKEIFNIENDHLQIKTRDPRERAVHKILATGETIFDILHQKNICESKEWLCSITELAIPTFSLISDESDVKSIESKIKFNHNNNNFVIELYRKIGENYVLIYSQHNCKKNSEDK